MEAKKSNIIEIVQNFSLKKVLARLNGSYDG